MHFWHNRSFTWPLSNSCTIQARPYQALLFHRSCYRKTEWMKEFAGWSLILKKWYVRQLNRLGNFQYSYSTPYFKVDLLTYASLVFASADCNHKIKLVSLTGQVSEWVCCIVPALHNEQIARLRLIFDITAFFIFVFRCVFCVTCRLIRK